MGVTRVSTRSNLALTHPEHLEPNPLRREFCCPVKFVPESKPVISTPKLQAKVMASKTKSAALEALFDWASQHGINSDAPDGWWEKRATLTTPSS